MKAVVLGKHGGPEALRFREVPDLTPSRNEVRVRTHAIGLNFAEVLSRKGLYGWTPKLPYVLGMEAAGVVDRVGADVTTWAVGDRVVVGQQFGSYAEQVLVRETHLLPALPDLSMRENAAFGVNYMTAWVALVEIARLRATDRVAITAAAGGVGTAAVQLARAHGCHVVALAGSDEKLALAAELGAETTVRYGDPGFPDRLAAAVGDDGVDVVLEVVGGQVFAACKDVLAPFGRMVVAGYAGLDYSIWNPVSWWRAWSGAPRMSLKEMYKGSKGLSSTHLGYLLEDAARMRRVWDDLVSFVEQHGIRPRIGHVFPFQDIAAAHALMESRASTGKVVLDVTHSAQE